MAKKRRVRSGPSTPARAAPAPAREAAPPSPAPTTALPRRPTSGLANYDYTYVRRDLRRIAALAALLLGTQVALAFLLPHLMR